MSKLRIISEHTIGMLKGRFQWLKSIPSLLIEGEETTIVIVKYMECCMILHNLLGTSLDEFPEEWLVDGMEQREDVANDEPDFDDQENVPMQPRDQLRQDVTNFIMFRNPNQNE